MVVTTNRSHGTRFLAMVIIGILAAVSGAAWSLTGHFRQGKERERVVEKALTRNQVVEFTEIKVSEKLVSTGKAFDGDDEWLNKSLVKVKNISDKPIVYLSVTFDFPETTKTGTVMSYPVVFGQKPGSKFPQNREPIFMMPGDTLEIHLDKDYAKIRSFVERRHRIADIHKLELAVGFVVFADKTGWAAGNFYSQDPTDPDHYINIGDRPEPNQ
jgi:hypothetical protein